MRPDSADGDGGPPGPLAAAPPARVLFDLLAHPRRARTVRLLADAPDRAMDADALASILAESPDAAANAASTGPTRHDLALSLVHVHLPRLAAAGVVAHDAGDGTVHLLVDPDALAPFLDLLE